MTIEFSDFEKVDIRIGKIKSVKDFPEARKPAYIIEIDFGTKIGTKKSSAQLTKHYSKEELINKLVLAVVNFKPRQIGPIMSEVLVLAVPDEENEPVLLSPSKEIPLGGKLY